jgi:pimeloyl-[acyl-carrier protein] methyl ester esterase
MDASLGYAELTELVRAQLPNGPFILLGESFSGPIAIELALTEQARVKGLVLAVTFARPSILKWLSPKLLKPFTMLCNPALAPGWLTNFLLFGAFGSPELRARLNAVLSRLPAAVVRRRLQEILSVDKTALLTQIKCPTVYLRGSKDRLVGASSADLIQTGIRDCRVETLAAPHMLLATHVDEVVAISQPV